MAKRMSAREWQQLIVESAYRVPNLARLMKLSRRQVTRIIRREFAVTPHSWLSEKRLTKAADLLMSGKEVREVAADLCYKQSSHFCRQFKEYYGVTPSDYVSAKKRRADVLIR